MEMLGMKGLRGESVSRRVAAQAERYKIMKVFDVERNALLWEVTCVECGRRDKHNWGVTSTKTMVGNLRRQGWGIEENSSPTCPDCVTKEIINMSKPTAIGPDPKIARKIYAALDEHFDDIKRTYHAGWSDERVAKELDVSQEIVINIRKSAYGELAVDPAIAKLTDDITLVRMEFEEAMGNMAKSFAVRFAELDRQLAVMRGNKKAVC